MFCRFFSKQAFSPLRSNAYVNKVPLNDKTTIPIPNKETNGFASLFSHNTPSSTNRISSGLEKHGNFIIPIDEYNEHLNKTTASLDQFVPLEVGFKPGDNYEEEDLLLKIPIKQTENPLISNLINSEISESGGDTIIKYQKKVDVFKMVKYPLENEYMNVALLSKFISPQGKIFSRTKTGLSVKSHKEMSKCIIRSRQLGILPYMYRPTTNFNIPPKKRNRF